MSIPIIPLIPEGTYHIYNRANADDLLFTSDENYLYFLKKYENYILPLADTFCYCLMSNHFHFLIRIKEQKIIEDLFKEKLKEKNKYELLQNFKNLKVIDKQHLISNYISQQWSHFLNGYTQAFNKKNHRRGSLFMRNFKRKLVDNEQYLKKLVHYIHYNPVEAGLVSKPENWTFSSYKTIISDKDTKLKREEVISWFDDLENFKYCHKAAPNETGIDFF